MHIISTLQIWDSHLLNIIREHFTLHTSWFPIMILALADSEPILFALLLISLWLYAIYRKEKATKYVALDLFWHVMGAFVVYSFLNHFLPFRPRPETVSTIPPLINHLPDNSFPSGHAIFFGASWWALARLTEWKKTTYFFFFLGLITVTARVIAGIHYPGDILVGFFLGWGIVYLLISLPHGKRYRKYCHDIIVQTLGKVGL